MKLSMGGLKQSVESFQNESKATADIVNRLSSEKDNLNQQIISYLTNIDLLKRVRKADCIVSWL